MPQDSPKPLTSETSHRTNLPIMGATMRMATTGIFRITSRRRGGALIMAVVFVAIAAMVTSYVMLASNRQMRNAHRSTLFNTSLSAAATMVKSMRQQAYFMATTRPTQLKGNFEEMDNVILSIQPTKLPGYVSAKSGAKDLTFFRTSSPTNGTWGIVDDAKDDWNGFTIRRWSYDAVAFMNEQDAPSDAGTGARAKHLGFEGAGFKANVQVNYIPLYQYAIFYNKDLEFHPGAPMTVEGPVHTNSTLWIAGGKALKFNDKISAAGTMRSYRDFADMMSKNLQVNINKKDGTTWKPETSDHTDTVHIKKKSGSSVGLNTGLPDGTDTNGNGMLDSRDSNWLNTALDRFGGNLTDAAMGNKPIQPPLPFTGEGDNRKQADPSLLIERVKASDPDDVKAIKMESMADILIEGDPSKVVTDPVTQKVSFQPNAITIRPQIIDAVTGLKTGYGPAIPNIVDGKALVTPGKFTDYRENRVVSTFDLNMDVMRTRPAISSAIAGGNGVIYASTSSEVSPGTQMNAIRVTNATKLPTKTGANTLTIATDRPMYLEGNVNNDANRATLLLAADAMYVTSQRLTETSNKPKAVETVTNAIFMLGQVSSKYTPVGTNKKPIAGVNVDSNGIPYRDQVSELDHYAEGYGRFDWSGGAHNVLRYLEDWGGVKHKYNGSLICLFESKVARAPHRGTYYDAPTREYVWDASLKTKEPPRGMPILVEVKMSRLERISKAEAVHLLPK